MTLSTQLRIPRLACLRRCAAALTPALIIGLGAVGAGIGHAEELTKEQLMKQLECRDNQQDCQAPPPPTSARRGFQRRGITFVPFTEEERQKIDQKVKEGKLPSADVEVYFDYDRAEITPSTRQILKPLGEALVDPKLADSRFILIGHTDAKGGDAYNQALSERRAAAIKDYLVATYAIAPDRLVAYGRGKSALKNTADPYAAENRRVQVINNGRVAGADH